MGEGGGNRTLSAPLVPSPQKRVSAPAAPAASASPPATAAAAFPEVFFGAISRFAASPPPSPPVALRATPPHPTPPLTQGAASPPKVTVVTRVHGGGGETAGREGESWLRASPPALRAAAASAFVPGRVVPGRVARGRAPLCGRQPLQGRTVGVSDTHDVAGGSCHVSCRGGSGLSGVPLEGRSAGWGPGGARGRA